MLLRGGSALAQPVVEFGYSEFTGTTTTNSGLFGGTGSFVQTDGRPIFTNRVPVGAFAPANNLSSVDFGDIAAGQGGRAIDFITASGDGSLGPLTAFTVCGWLNARNLNEGFGGNRIAFALASPDGPGFDLVQTAGALRIGINQWPDGGGGGGPSSAAGRITADPATGTNNWMFFAVTYDSTLGSGQLRYYFGKHNQAAALDTTHTYARGPINTSGRLTVGNFGAVVAARNEVGPGGGSRVFRGLIDELKVFDRALTAGEVQVAQTAGSFVPVSAAPFVAQLVPSSNTAVRVLRQLEVIFSEAVTGVNASDLLVNGTAATNVVAVSPDDYVFKFPDTPPGVVTFEWAPGHGVRDLGAIPADFVGGAWTNVVDPLLVAAPPIISEFMADNDNTLADDDGDSSDWIEIHNPDSEPLNLDGFFLFDSTSRWRFPAVVMPGFSYLVVFASEKNRTNPFAPLHTNFRLERSGEHLALLDPQTNVLSEFAPAFPAQFEDVSYGRDRLTPGITGYFTAPTPGRANSSSGAGFASDVQFSVASGSFTTPFELTLTTATLGAVIRYILVNTGATASNTNVPGTNSPIYTGPLQITNTIQVRARAFASGLFPGTPVSATYVRLDTNLLQRTSDLPFIVVHTLGGGTIAQSAFKNAHVSIYETKYGRASLAAPPDVTTRAALRVRGNTSASSPKQSWSLELRDEFDRDLNLSLLGMPAESDWALYGPNAIEPVYIHNPFSFELARQMGQWAPRTRFVEVYLNTAGGTVTTNNYYGLYILMERVKVTEGRIDEPGLDAEDTNAPAVTGTYLMQVDRLESGESGVRFPPVLPNTLSGGGNAITYTDPKEAEIRLPQRDPQEQYILNYMTNFTGTLNGPGFAHAVTGYQAYVNLTPSIDQHILKTFAISVDAFNFSTYFYKSRNGKLTFGPVWDFDRSLSSNNDSRDDNPRVWRPTTAEIFDFFNYSWWGRMFQDANFWQLWVDRYQELRETVFSQTNLLGLADFYANQCRESQPRDVGRWPGVTTPRFGGYQGEVQNMKDWMTNRLHFMDTNFLPRPGLSTPGGRISPGFTFSIGVPDKPGTQIYYTLDGTDPRAPGGTVSVSAQLYSGAVTVHANAHVVARSFNANHRNLSGVAQGNPPASTSWSGPVRALLVVDEPPLRITEIMYHPAPPAPGDTNEPNNFEFIEVRNISSTLLDVGGFRFSEGVQFTFPNTTLAGGESAVIVRNVAAFQSRYGSGPRVLGVFTNQLDNAGERLRLEGPVGEAIHDFRFEQDWYRITDGFGFSLVIVNEDGLLASWALKEGWRPSGALGGSPGADEPAPPPSAQVVVNEVLTHTDLPQIDAIELRNPSASATDIGGWFLTDNFREPKKYRFANSTSIPANGFLVVYETNFNTGPNAFSLSSLGDEVYLFSADLAGNLTGYYRGFDFGPQFNGVTFGRHVNSVGEDHLVAQTAASFGSANVGPRVGPVVISEIQYQPVDVFANGAFWNNLDDEYLELHNLGGSPAPLFDPAFPTNTWRLRDAVDFTFPPGVTIPIGGFVLVANVNPNDAAALSAFRARNNLASGLSVFGPFQGALDNSGDSVELVRPDAPVPAPSADEGLVPYVLVDKVRYSKDAPWPAGSGGFGGTLQRVPLNAYGNDPGNWVAAGATPGAASSGSQAPVVTAQPQSITVIQSYTATFSVTASSTPPLRYQWDFGGQALFGATNSTLMLTNVQPGQAGLYRCYVLSSGGITASSNAALTVLAQARITQQPQNVSLRGSTNSADYGSTTNRSATFTIGATSTSQIRYQWRFNSAPIDGATNASLTVTNVNLAKDGIYDVAVTDDVSTQSSAPARLTVLVTPIIVVRPVDQTIAAGSDFTMSVELIGNPPPFAYSWRRSSIVIASNYGNFRSNFITLHSTTAGLILTNNILSSNYTMRLVVYNEANSAPGVLVNFTNTVVADIDLDGIPDVIEQGLGLDANNAVDGALDLDGDGVSNRAEYLAGTDPTNNASYLRIDQGPGAATVSVAAVSNRTYSVQFTDALGSDLWRRLGDVVATPNNHAVSFIDTSWTTNRFYRVVLPAQP